MTQFGITPSSTSPAARRIYEAGQRYAESLRADFARQAEEMRRHLAEQAAERAAAQSEARRRAMMDRMEIAVEIARNLPRQTAGRVKDIMADVCVLHEVSMAEMLGPQRNRRVVHARQHAMWLCYQHTHFSMPRLGRFFRRDHTTVLHGIRAHEKRMAKEG